MLQALLVRRRHSVDDDLAELRAMAKRHGKRNVGDGVLRIDLNLGSHVGLEESNLPKEIEQRLPVGLNLDRVEWRLDRVIRDLDQA